MAYSAADKQDRLPGPETNFAMKENYGLDKFRGIGQGSPVN